MISDVKSEAADSRDGLGDSIDIEDLITWLRLGQDPNASRAATEITKRFRPLIQKYWRQKRCGNYDDFSQDVMVRLFTALPHLDDSKAFPGLFKTIVVRTAADYWRHQGFDDSHLVDCDVDLLEEAFDEDLSIGLVVKTYLNLLSPREKGVLELIYLYDLPTFEVARLFGLSVGAVRMTKARALARLRNQVENTK